MSNIVLIGMPGAGKSTVGVLLAKTLKRSFLDTDLLIQTHTNRYLQEIIDNDGMDAFLAIEAEMILTLDVANMVIATGGSVIYRENAMRHLQQSGIIIYLASACETIEHRIGNISIRGIARRPGQEICDLYMERHLLYQRYADITITTDEQPIEAVVTGIAACLRD